MPLSFNFEEELAKQAAKATLEGSGNQANIMSLGNAVFKEVIAISGEINLERAGAMLYELHWNSMMAQNLFDHLSEKGEKCAEEQRPVGTYSYTDDVGQSFTVQIKYFTENGELVLKCHTLTPSGETRDHSVRLSDVVKTH